MTPLSSFELLALNACLNGNSVWFYVIYRPPPSSKNKIAKSLFLTEFAKFLESVAIQPGQFCILGDFNIPWDKVSDPERKDLASLLDSMDLVQHVQEQTHTRGHTINYLITRSDSQIMSSHTVGEFSVRPCYSTWIPKFFKT